MHWIVTLQHLHFRMQNYLNACNSMLRYNYLIILLKVLENHNKIINIKFVFTSEKTYAFQQKAKQEL